MKRHVSPSRRRYEQNNPGATFRLTLDQHRRLQELIAKTGKSRSQLLKEGLGLVEARVEEAYTKGYRKGFDEAWGRFQVNCSLCDKPVDYDIKTQPAVREAIEKEYFVTWFHGSCKKKERPFDDLR